MVIQKPQDIKERTFQFAVRIVHLAQQLPDTTITAVVAKQLMRSGTSIGANVEEAVAAHSKADFICKTGIALREARETHYWLRVIEASEMLPVSQVAAVLNEGGEIMKILGAIVSKARGKRKDNKER